MEHRITRSVFEAVLRPSEPVAVVYMGNAPAVVNEYQLEWETRWRPLADKLRDEGADDATIAALESAVRPSASARAARGQGQVAGFARAGQVLAVLTTVGMPAPDLARYGSPGHMLPLLQWQQLRPPYVFAAIDRTGADLEISIGEANAPVRSTVDGPDDEIEKNAPGGWEGLAQGRYQRRAEDSWAHNAGAVAEAVAAAVRRVEADILVIAGDDRAEHLFLEKLPESVRKGLTVKRIPGSRSRDGSEQNRAGAIEAAVREAVEEQTAALWQQFLEERHPHGLAVEGGYETLGALASGRVATLFVAEDAAMGAKAWFGPAPTEVVPVGEGLPVPPEARKGRLVDVAVRAALLTGGEVRVIPAAAGFWPMEGVGGICRFH
ncbi:MAG TPA: Vms1/Ankzf1 family peptidyl-tRNA hydrolase [Nocardioidaceae bacterium]|nr:Vms1/Ankzf1 family peptidyl-tRNA hydrolase [Nocardioidaceae bacterium]